MSASASASVSLLSSLRRPTNQPSTGATNRRWPPTPTSTPTPASSGFRCTPKHRWKFYFYLTLLFSVLLFLFVSHHSLPHCSLSLSVFAPLPFSLSLCLCLSSLLSLYLSLSISLSPFRLSSFVRVFHSNFPLSPLISLSLARIISLPFYHLRLNALGVKDSWFLFCLPGRETKTE